VLTVFAFLKENYGQMSYNSVLRVRRRNVVVIQKNPLQQYFACCKVFIFSDFTKKGVDFY